MFRALARNIIEIIMAAVRSTPCVVTNTLRFSLTICLSSYSLYSLAVCKLGTRIKAVCKLGTRIN